MRIYIISSWRNVYQPAVVARLRDLGHTVYDFRHPRELAFLMADVTVLVLPCGRSPHLDFGFALGQGKKTAILMIDQVEPEVMYKLATRLCLTMDELTSWLETCDE